MTDDPISSQFKYHPEPTGHKWHDAVALLRPEISITPYVGKCLYFVGTVRHVIDAASRLYRLEEYKPHGKSGSQPKPAEYNLPALLLTCTMVELLGRCHLGHESNSEADKERIHKAFQKIIRTSFPHKKDNNLKVWTSKTQYYSHRKLQALRNFGAHGFSGTDEPDLQIDRLFIGWLLGAFGETLDNYFAELKNSEDVAKQMAKAGISPIIFQESDQKRRPIHIEKIYKFLSDDESDNKQPGKFAFEDRWYAEYMQVKSLPRNQPKRRRI